MMLMQMMNSPAQPVQNNPVQNNPVQNNVQDDLKEAPPKPMAFNRRICHAGVERIAGLNKVPEKYNPGSLAKKHITAENARDVIRLLKAGIEAAPRALNAINPVSIAIRNTPWYISKPLELTCEEVQTLNRYLTHPVSTAQEMAEYFYSDPVRTIKLLKVLGAPIPRDVLLMAELDDDLEKGKTLYPIVMKKGADPVVGLNKNMGRLRGKMVLSTIKALTGDKVDLLEDLEKYAIAMLETAGTRVMAKTIKHALKETDNISTGQNPKTDEEGDVYYDAQS